MARFHRSTGFQIWELAARLNVHPNFQGLVRSSIRFDGIFPLPMLHAGISFFYEPFAKVFHSTLCSFPALLSASLSFSMVSPKLSLFLFKWLAISQSHSNVPSSTCDHTFSHSVLETCFSLSTMEFKRQEDIKDNSPFTGKTILQISSPPPSNCTFMT